MRSLLLSAALLLTSASALAQPKADFQQPWSAGTSVAEEVRAGKPLVVLVVVPLCSNAQINCGSGIAGRGTCERTCIGARSSGRDASLTDRRADGSA